MLTYNVQGRIAIPIRAIPVISPGFFGPAVVMKMMVDVESYGEAPALHAFRVDKSGQTHSVHPLDMTYECDAVVRAASTADLKMMLSAMPADVMVWSDDAKAMYDFLDHEVFLQESRSARPETMRHWFSKPSVSDSVRQIILAGKEHMTLTGYPKPASSNKRQRDIKGSNDAVQQAAEELAREYHAKHSRWPKKKGLLSGIAAKLPHRTADPLTLLREFKVTWKQST